MRPTLPDSFFALAALDPGASSGTGGPVHFPTRRPNARIHPAPDAGGTSSGSGGPDGHLRVLVVEDNLDTADVLDTSLHTWGYASRVCTSGNEALALFPYYLPHVVLIDIGLPDMDGWELARRLRQRRDGAPPVLIAITAHGEQHDYQRSQLAGISFHLVKPAFQPQLREILERLAGGN
ncbi:MAG TPA: response regulator [Pirellulales bacterium]|nr:response regulator [Pirellulales bacterium]